MSLPPSSYPMIEVSGLGKEYRLGVVGATTLKEDIQRFFQKAKTSQDNDQHIWALRDVSFNVSSGEVLGLIGHNGGGKSTLLKLLSRITEPTEGEAILRGRVASLLEVGTGFHPDLTGRENIFLNGTLLGMRAHEVQDKLQQIIEFSGVGQFIDTPVKRYSSGMRVRLAFAVAAHLEPEILLVDEVLAVGDAAFQEKCLGRMREVTEEGRTVIFVSHNMDAITTLTDRCLVLNHGKVIHDGPSSEAVCHYLSSLADAGEAYTSKANSEEARLTHAEVITSDSGMVHEALQPLTLNIQVDSPFELHRCSTTIRITDALGKNITRVTYSDEKESIPPKAGKLHFECRIPEPRLCPGNFRICVWFSAFRADSEEQVTFYQDDVCPFQVVASRTQLDATYQKGRMVYVEKFNWKVSSS